MFRFLIIICFPLYSIAQQEVLDGIYVNSQIKPEEFGKHATKIGGELKMYLELNQYSKPTKIAGFQFLNSLDFFLEKVPLDERKTSYQAFNTCLYTQPMSNLIGIANNGDVRILKDSVIENNLSFYLKRHEVTNAEYREFVTYVFDSLTLSILAEEEPERFLINKGEKNQRLNWNNYSKDYFLNEDYVDVLGDLFYGENDERFYKRKQIDSRRLNYEYWNKDSSREVLNIYPDTLKWVYNLNQEIMESNTQMYFWHPVYDNHPVVGISHKQTLAYLDWRLKQGFKELDKKGIKYEIGLPTPEEWEFTASVMYGFDEKLNATSATKNLNRFFDKSITLDLVLKHHPKYTSHALNNDDIVYYNNYASEIKTQHTDPYFSSFEESYHDGSVTTCKVDWKNDKMKGYHAAKRKVFHLGTNVSEWLDASFVDYKGYLTLKAKTLMFSMDKGIVEIGKELMTKINSFSDTNHQLIMGANWMNEHPEMYYGAPLKALYAKTFAHRDSSYSTVGFRYVIRIKSQQAKINDVLFEKTNPLDIFKELNIAGFILKNDSNNTDKRKTTFLNPSKEKEIKNRNIGGGVLDGIYVAHHNRNDGSFTKKTLNEEYPNLIKKITSSGGEIRSFYSILSNQYPNLLVEYRLKAINDYTIELIRW